VVEHPAAAMTSMAPVHGRLVQKAPEATMSKIPLLSFVPVMALVTPVSVMVKKH
jgi:hypothetical protein